MYFSYGKLSNRSLLLRYGFALEFNQYEKVFINVPYIESINSGVDIASVIFIFILSIFLYQRQWNLKLLIQKLMKIY